LLLENCTFRSFNKKILDTCRPFDCGHEDLNDFFLNDCIPYSNELIGKSYCFTLDENPETIVCAFTISNDSIKVADLPNSRKKKVNELIPRSKQFRSYPAVLIGRLGVNQEFKRKGIGPELMDFIKAWFIDGENKTGCRFIVVDSYNESGPLNFYTKCGFKTLFSTEEQEKEYLNISEEERLSTRLMYFDLIILKS
jgi:GNAT superfamily N-acetyltransferase